MCTFDFLDLGRNIGRTLWLQFTCGVPQNPSESYKYDHWFREMLVCPLVFGTPIWKYGQFCSDLRTSLVFFASLIWIFRTQDPQTFPLTWPAVVNGVRRVHAWEITAMDSMMEGNGVILEEATVTGGDYCCDGLSWTCFVGCKTRKGDFERLWDDVWTILVSWCFLTRLFDWCYFLLMRRRMWGGRRFRGKVDDNVCNADGSRVISESIDGPIDPDW